MKEKKVKIIETKKDWGEPVRVMIAFIIMAILFAFTTIGYSLSVKGAVLNGVGIILILGIIFAIGSIESREVEKEVIIKE